MRCCREMFTGQLDVNWGGDASDKSRHNDIIKGLSLEKWKDCSILTRTFESSTVTVAQGSIQAGR